VSDSDEGYLIGWWTSYSRLSSDSEAEPTTPDEESTVPEGALWTREIASAPPVGHSRIAEGWRRYDELARRLVLSPSSERGMTEEASSYPAEVFREGLMPSARSEHCTAEGALSYLTKEFVEGLVTSVSSGLATTEEASSYLTEEFMERLVPSVDSETASPEILDGLGISAANPAVGLGGPPAVAIGTGVPINLTARRQKFADDIMPYSYPKYFNHLDAAAHVKQFRSIWAGCKSQDARIDSNGTGAIHDR
jgi:hypothetical protein